MNNLFNPVTPLKFWCQKVLPLVYDDSLSYYEVLCKVSEKINELVENNKNLPDYIEEEIKLQLSDTNLEKIVGSYLTDFVLNVKFPPEGIPASIGDGVADDHDSIQMCIDYANENGGKALYFPDGVYITSPLTLKNSVSIFGASTNSAIIKLKANSTNSLFSGTSSNNTISRITIDGNIASQVNELTLISLNGSNMSFDNLVLSNSNKAINIINTGNIVMMNSLRLNNCPYFIQLSGAGYAVCDNLCFNNTSVASSNSLINNSLPNSMFTNLYSILTINTAITNTGTNCYYSGIIKNAENIINDNTNNITYNFYGDKKITSNKSITEATTTKQIYVTNLNETIAKRNVNGDSSVEVLTGNKTQNSVINTENVTTKIINATNIVVNGRTSEEILTGNKTQNSEVNTENVTTKIINATDINLNTSNPLTYKTPGSLNKYFKYVPFKGQNGTEYSVLVSNDYDFSLKPRRKAIYIGDSYFNGVGATPTTDLVYYINKKCGIVQHWNYSHGATGFIRDTDSLKFYNQLVQASNDSRITDKTEVTDIIVAGGLNDTGASWTQTALYTECNNISTLAKTAFPNAKLWYIPFLWINIPYSYDYHRLYIAINKACLKSGDATLSGAPSWLYRMDSKYQNGDDIHPSAIGYELMSDYICNFLNGGYQGVNDLQLVSDTVGQVDYSICCEIVNSIIYLKGNFNVKATIPAITNMGNLPSRAIPQSLTVLPCIYYNSGSNTNSPLYIQANDSKITTINSLTAGTYHITTSYPLYPFIGV